MLQSYPTLLDHMDCSPPGSSVLGVLQARIREWAAISSSRASSQPRDLPALAGRIFATETHGKSLSTSESRSVRAPGLCRLMPSLDFGDLPLLMARESSSCLGNKSKILTSHNYLFYSVIPFLEAKQDTDPRCYCWSVTQAGLDPRSPEPQSRGL